MAQRGATPQPRKDRYGPEPKQPRLDDFKGVAGLYLEEDRPLPAPRFDASDPDADPVELLRLHKLSSPCEF